LVSFLEKKGIEVHQLSARAQPGQSDPLQFMLDPQKIAAIFRFAKPDFIFHLAGVTKNPDRILMHQVNSLYALAILQALELAGQSQTPILLVGTAAEYGFFGPEQLPMREETLGIPYNHYGISKLTQTLIGLSAARQGQRVVIVRPSNIIGPGMPDHLFLGHVARQLEKILASKHPPVIKVGNISTARDFIDVKDVVEIYWKLIQTDEAYGQVINVCTGRAYPMDRLLDKLLKMIGIHVNLDSDPDLIKQVDLPIYYGSTEKLRKLIGYVPTFDPTRSLKAIAQAINFR
jgi:GDP-4-dehydro-6-deoxy-D-mannose reductase